MTGHPVKLIALGLRVLVLFPQTVYGWFSAPPAPRSGSLLSRRDRHSQRPITRTGRLGRLGGKERAVRGFGPIWMDPRTDDPRARLSRTCCRSA
jgi:hypothetical protein